MLHVHRREHVDAGVEDVLYVLVALAVVQARRVGVRELVDQAQLRPPGEDPGEVEVGDRRTTVGHAPAREPLEPHGARLGLRPAMRLEQADHDVAARLELGTPLVEHPHGLPHPGRHAEEHLQVAAIIHVTPRGRCGRPGR
jgi:hypothetical protein